MPMLESMCWRPWAPWVQIDLSFAGPDGKFHPFHLYKMRWAIEEEFILDVLANYTSYKTDWRIEKAVSDAPQYDAAKARQAIATWVSLRASNLSQVRTHTASKIGGRAKAMVVTSSRLHAVRYKQAIDTYIHDRGYSDIAALVAFSGKVITGEGSWVGVGG